jgi:hypothetical protein
MGAMFLMIALIPGVTGATAPFLLVFGASYFFAEFGPNTTTFVMAAECYPRERPRHETDTRSAFDFRRTDLRRSSWDPAVAFGYPVIEGAGACVKDVLDRFWAGEALRVIADDLPGSVK